MRNDETLRGTPWGAVAPVTFPQVSWWTAPRNSMELRGFPPWSSVELRGAPWSSVELRGALWIPFEGFHFGPGRTCGSLRLP